MTLTKYLSEKHTKHTVWTEKDMQQLYAMAKKKTPIQDVYEAFKPRTKKAVNAKIVRMYLSRKDDVLQVLP